MSRYRTLAAACGALMATALAPPLAAQMGLERVEYLALQQELRSRGCGDIAAGGQVDAATQRALRACAQQLGVAANARAVLNAMDIGFGPGYEVPTVQEARDPMWQPEAQPMQPAQQPMQPMQPTDPMTQPTDPQMQPEPGYPPQPPAGQAPAPAQPGLEPMPPAPQPGTQPPPTQPPVTQPPPGSQPPVIP